MGPKWAKIDLNMSPWIAGLKLATWIVDIFVWFYGLLVLLAAAVLLRPRRGSWKLLLKANSARDAYCRETSRK